MAASFGAVDLYLSVLCSFMMYPCHVFFMSCQIKLRFLSVNHMCVSVLCVCVSIIVYGVSSASVVCLFMGYWSPFSFNFSGGTIFLILQRIF